MANFQTMKSSFGEKVSVLGFLREAEWKLFAELFQYHPETGLHCIRVALSAHEFITRRHELPGLPGRSFTFGQLLAESGIGAEPFIRAALFHDIGKLRVRHEILSSPCGLTHLERREMERHEEASADILMENGFTLEAGIAGQHHNYRREGPKVGFYFAELGKLFSSGDLLHIVDVHDALVTPRCYKPAFSLDKALSILCQDATEGRVDADLTTWHVRSKLGQVEEQGVTELDVHRFIRNGWTRIAKACTHHQHAPETAALRS